MRWNQRTEAQWKEIVGDAVVGDIYNNLHPRSEGIFKFTSQKYRSNSKQDFIGNESLQNLFKVLPNWNLTSIIMKNLNSGEEFMAQS
jgi:hypothetical protein